jgi:hypothetical protein
MIKLQGSETAENSDVAIIVAIPIAFLGVYFPLEQSMEYMLKGFWGSC